jgi:hypothetical protein
MITRGENSTPQLRNFLPCRPGTLPESPPWPGARGRSRRISCTTARASAATARRQRMFSASRSSRGHRGSAIHNPQPTDSVLEGSVVSDVIKSRIRQLYQFLKEANQLRFRPVRTIDLQPKIVRLADLPDHPAMQLLRPVRGDHPEAMPDTLLRVQRPLLTRCPEPPSSIAGWLLPKWGRSGEDAGPCRKRKWHRRGRRHDHCWLR